MAPEGQYLALLATAVGVMRALSSPATCPTCSLSGRGAPRTLRLAILLGLLTARARTRTRSARLARLAYFPLFSHTRTCLCSHTHTSILLDLRFALGTELMEPPPPPSVTVRLTLMEPPPSSSLTAASHSDFSSQPLFHARSGDRHELRHRLSNNVE